MPNWSREEVQKLLEERVRKEAVRLKDAGWKIGVDDLARITTDFVLSLMADARRREVSRVLKAIEEEKLDLPKLLAYLNARKEDTRKMASALWTYAETKEAALPRKHRG